jgi:exodeoxyribonuclease V alpha subunit
MYQLELAYALSVHKSQGTEYPVVILICHNNFGRMLRRRVYYTGITRAQKLCIIIGQEGALINAIENDNERLRLSSLKSRISNL